MVMIRIDKRYNMVAVHQWVWCRLCEDEDQ
jgi:hypothetical protein